MKRKRTAALKDSQSQQELLARKPKKENKNDQLDARKR